MIWLEIAWRNVLRNWRRSLFTISIAAVGTIAVLLAVGYMLSAFEAVRESTIRGGLGHLQIAHAEEFGGYSEYPLQHGLPPNTVAAIREAIGKAEPYAMVMPRLEFQGVASNGERSLIFLGEGVEPLEERRLSQYYAQVIDGQGLERTGDKPFRAVIGHDLARLLGLKVGDSLALMSPTATSGLNAIDVEVVGLLKTGVPQVDRTRVLVPLELAQKLIRTGKINRLVLGLDDTGQTDAVQARLAPVAKRLGIESRTWTELAVFYHQLVDLYLRQFSVLGAIIAVVVALTFSNAVLMSVLERSREIGTLVSLGIGRAQIRRQFVLEGLLLGLGGGTLAALLSWLLMLGLNALAIQMPPPPGQTEGYPLFFLFSLPAALAAVAGVSVLGTLSAFFASRRVTRLDPIKALHYA
ncbi:ABC transporter permease [Chitinimonas lacunae]|uniref:ABC transporter permease n=1 Tax=Chitinimonas lacunae TaxID=1963018 RepID=A0ABV8MML7_9NEIS